MRIFIGFLIGVIVSVAVAAIAVVTLAPGLWDADALSRSLSVRLDSFVQIFSESRSDDEEQEPPDVDRMQSIEADRGMLSAIVPSPRTIVFQEAGESVWLELTGVYSDGSEETLADLGTKASFSSSEPDVVQVDAGGLVASVSPGGADIIIVYEEFRAQVPIIVYGPIVEIPPFDPDKVVQIEDGPEVVVNRIVVVPQTEEYDAELTEAIASEYSGAIIAEFKNLNLFSLEFDIDALDALETKLEELEADERIESATPNFLFITAQTPTPQNAPTPTHNYTFGVLLVQTQTYLENLQRQDKVTLKPVNIAVIDNGFFDCKSASDKAFCANVLGGIKVQKIMPKASSKASNDHHGTVDTSVISSVVSTAGPNLDATLHIYDSAANRGEIRSALEKIRSSSARRNSLTLENVLSASNHIYPHKDKIDVINMSNVTLCGAIAFSCKDDLEVIKNIIEKLLHDNMIIVAGAGNNSADVKDYFPANLSAELDNVIAVGGLNKNATDIWKVPNTGWNCDHDETDDNGLPIDCGSNYGLTGEAVTVAAQAEDVPIETPNGSGKGSGTPLVTGVVALMRAVNPRLTPKEIREILFDTGDILM